MAKRKRHTEFGERVEDANHKRAKAENSASTQVASFSDLAGSDGPKKASGDEHKARLHGSRKHKNAGRALKHEAKDKEQSGDRVDVPGQNENDKGDVHEDAEHKAPLQSSRERKNSESARKRAEKEEKSGPKGELPVPHKNEKSDGHERAEENEHKIPLQGPRKHNNKEGARKRAGEEEKSGPKVEAAVQNMNSNSDRNEHAEGSERQARIPGSRKHNNPERARQRAEEKGQSGPKVELPVQNKISKSDGNEHAEGSKRQAPLPGSRKHNNAERARERAEEEEQSGPKVEMPAQNKHDKSEVYERAGGKKEKASLQGSRKHNNQKRAIEYQAEEKEQSEPKVEVPVQNKHDKSEVHEHAGGKKDEAPLQGSHKRKNERRALKYQAKEQGQSGPKAGDLPQKQDGEAINVAESGKVPEGKDESEVFESPKGQDVQRHSSEKTKPKSSKKSKLKSSDGVKVERSVASESAVERAVAASYPEWTVSRSTGGQMLDTDPVFSEDEEYILISYPTYVVVYATATSLPVGTLRIKKGERIAATCLSPFDAKRLYIISKSGTIELWDWSDSKKADFWKLSHDSKFLRVNKRGDANEQVLAYIIHHKPVWQLCVYDLTNTGRVSKDATRPLFTHEDAITSLDVLDDGKQIVMTSGAQVMLGTCQEPHPTDLQSLTYDWHIVTCPDWIASIDVRVRPAERDKKGQQRRRTPFQSIDLALGCLRGSIHLYDDLQHQLYQQQTSSHKVQAKDITSRQLHWHRNAVLAIKWSSDGRYVISGGQETVLVIWQLDTGRKDTLPHLGAPIEKLVVSPQGSSYAVRLADNSAMILSTAEMRPTFSVAGIQIPSVDYSSNVLPALPTADNAQARPKPIRQSYSPASVCPSRPGQLLVAVPPYCASRSSTIMSGNASYLQTVDLHSCQQLSRQALVRTKVTDLNMGPGGNLIEEPAVKHIATSHDGQWLATTDEWAPPARDIEPLTFDSEKAHEEQIFRQEVHLKFWSWNQARENWELVARIDTPHSSSSGSAYESGCVIALISNPSEVGFVAFGEDGNLTSWRPVTRRRHGSEVKGRDGVGLTNWRCSFSTFVVNPNEAGTTSTRPAAKLAYSSDGSVIALSLQTESAAPIYLLDGFDGSIRSVQTGLYSAPLLGLGIIDRHLIIVADDLIVWDLVNDEVRYRINLELLDLPHSTLTMHSHLAINLHDKTFALAMPAQGHRAMGRAGLKSDIAIFDPCQERPLFIETLPHATLSLQPETGGRGYHVIDSFAEIRAIAPHLSLPSPSAETAGLLSQTPHSKGLDQLFGRPSEARPNLLADQPEAKDVGDGNGNEGKRPEVKLEQLQALFNQAPSHALPPVDELFRQVIGLYGRKDGAAVA